MKRFQTEYSENSITYWPFYEAGKIGIIYLILGNVGACKIEKESMTVSVTPSAYPFAAEVGGKSSDSAVTVRPIDVDRSFNASATRLYVGCGKDGLGTRLCLSVDVAVNVG